MVTKIDATCFAVFVSLNDIRGNESKTNVYSFTAVPVGDSYNLYATKGEEVSIPLEAYREALTALFSGSHGIKPASFVRLVFTTDKTLFINSENEIVDALFNNIKISGSGVEV